MKDREPEVEEAHGEPPDGPILASPLDEWMTVLRLNFKNSPWSIPPAPACLLCSGFVACWLMWQLDLTLTPWRLQPWMVMATLCCRLVLLLEVQMHRNAASSQAKISGSPLQT
jgi:hypothetical protein